jgi:hypothetical protein
MRGFTFSLSEKMDQFQVAKLTISKICHDIANHISVMKFLYEDIGHSDVYEIKELLNCIDLLSCTMDFFRNIYSVSESLGNSLSIVANLARLSGVNLIDPDDSRDSIKSVGLRNLLAGILYLVIKCSKKGDNLRIVQDNLHNKFTIFADSRRKLSDAVIDALNEDVREKDVFNIFIAYLKDIAKGENIDMAVVIGEDQSQGLELWKK